MKKITLIFFYFLLVSNLTHAQLTPEVTSWIINTTNDTGYAGIQSNVQVKNALLL